MILPALSIRQPWAWFIIQGWKKVENRKWLCPQKFIGRRVLIHAGKHFSAEETWDIFNDVKAAGLGRSGHVTLNDVRAQCGGIVGVATITGCVRDSASPWAAPGQWHWTLADARPLPFFACPGKLGFFKVDYPHKVEVDHAH